MITANTKLIDPKCWELAEHFIHPANEQNGITQDLAVTIQQAIEDWFVGRCGEDMGEHDWCATHSMEGSGLVIEHEVCSKCHKTR